jgi:membrane peptidoglycan carboxypeptidase
LQTAQQYIAKMKNTHHMSNAAVVMLDYHTGAIRSFVGSLDSPTAANPLNVVTQTARQVGSAFKPFFYANAFAQGISPGEVVYDGPFAVGGPYGYAPYNYDGRYHGYMSYRSALQDDLNIAALKLFVKTGSASLRKMVQKLGLNDENLGPVDPQYYSMPLGPMEMPLLDITVAYGTMANGGIHVTPHAIEKISASDGHIIYAARARGTRALSIQAAFMITDVMSDQNGLSCRCIRPV